MLKKSGMIVLVTGLSMLLSSCHIKQKDVETIARSTDTLHIYKDREWIEYNVSAIDPVSGITTFGVLLVEWTATAALADPVDIGVTHNVLKETTTLAYNDDLSDPVVTVIRFISQVDEDPPAPNQGSIILHAIDDGSNTSTPGTAAYWLYEPSNTGNAISDVIAPIIFDSPMAVGVAPPSSSTSSPVNFSVMDGCASGTCGDELYQFTDGYTVEGDSSPISTNLGKFSNPFELSFSGTSAPGSNLLARAVLGDIRQACGSSDNNLIHAGNMFVMPEIGIIQMTNTCQVTSGTGSNITYIITIRNTNIIH